MQILRQQFLRHIGQTSPSPMLVEIERAEGSCFYTPEGKKYYDTISGVSVSNVGHHNPAVTEAVCRQAQQYMHVMVYGELVERPQVRYAALIADYLPDPLESVYFVNSGAEAVEGALKLAKRFTGRRRMIACRNAYHGSTHGAMSVMNSHEFSDAYGPMLPGVDWITYNNLADLDKINEETACVLIEPVQGEAGVRLPEKGYLEALGKKCDSIGTLLIFDEIQTGFGRTGEMFAMTKYGVTPDIVCLAKALGGGMPLGAFVSSRHIMECLSHDPALGHITTFGGHPVCCAAGLAAMEYITEHRLLGDVERKGAMFETLLASHSAVKEIRRSGLLMAVELGSSERLYHIMELFKERGILSDWFLFCDTAFRISPPLTMTDDEIRDVCDIIRGCLDDL